MDKPNKTNDSEIHSGPKERINRIISKEGMDLGSKRDLLDVSHLVRSIQRAEGNRDCFRQPEGYCDQVDCAWRAYCLEESEDDPDD